MKLSSTQGLTCVFSHTVEGTLTGQVRPVFKLQKRMANIGFTEKQLHVYHRFNALRRAYEDANGGGRVYNPDFLTVLMNGWEELERIAKSDDIVIITSENIVDRGRVVTEFMEQHFGDEKLEL